MIYFLQLTVGFRLIIAGCSFLLCARVEGGGISVLLGCACVYRLGLGSDELWMTFIIGYKGSDCSVVCFEPLHY